MPKKNDSEYSISVIIPVYNVEKYVKKCLESVINQTLSNDKFEILVIEDKSKDKSLEIVKEIISNSKNIKLIENPKNIGLGFSRNKGIEESKGEFLYFIDSDDYIEPDTLEKLLYFAKKEKADLVTAGYKRTNENEEILFEKNDYLQLPEDKYKVLSMMLADQITHTAWGKLVKKTLFTNNNITYPEGIHEDVPVTYLLFWYSENIYKTPDNTYNWLKREASITSYMSIEHIDGWFNAIKKQKDFIETEFDGEILERFLIAIKKGSLKAADELLSNILKYEAKDFKKRVKLYLHLYAVVSNFYEKENCKESQNIKIFQEIFSKEISAMKKAELYELFLEKNS